ncbi:MAG: carbohydrate-binding protein [Clostridia bacterium]|nr:carbohydrate-binding protein [Clostridia bacterium]
MPRTGQQAVTANNQFIANGITISPDAPVAGESVRVIYDGLLAKSGASDVLAHVGFGDKWENVFDYRMVKTVTGFEATIQVPSNTNTLNVCFKDCANNWDNNSGMDYSFGVSQ